MCHFSRETWFPLIEMFETTICTRLVWSNLSQAKFALGK